MGLGFTDALQPTRLAGYAVPLCWALTLCFCLCPRPVVFITPRWGAPFVLTPCLVRLSVPSFVLPPSKRGQPVLAPCHCRGQPSH
eukprot:scaffold31631_cov60-Phaeocystis_antarctica.AAC.8